MAGVSTIWAPMHRALARWANLQNGGFPPNAAPSLDYLASGIQDHRLPYNQRGSSAVQPGILGWYGTASTTTVNEVPSTLATANIAALANVVNNTAMTLVAATAAGITVLSAAVPATFYPTQLTLTAGRVIDALPSLVLFGAAGSFTTGFYNRSTYVGRAVSITGVTSGAGGAFLVRGYDIYGYPMSEQITAAAGVATTNGRKAFKVIASVTPLFTDAHNYSVGTADIFGFGLYINLFESTLLHWNGSFITANTGFVAGDTTSPATTTTGDVRGTYAVQSASDGTKRLSLRSTPVLTSLAVNPTIGLFGVAQV